MTEKAEELHKEIMYIQNSIWGMYKDFLADHDMGKYNQRKRELEREYLEKGDKTLYIYCQSILFDWASVMSRFAKIFGLQ